MKLVIVRNRTFNKIVSFPLLWILVSNIVLSSLNQNISKAATLDILSASHSISSSSSSITPLINITKFKEVWEYSDKILTEISKPKRGYTWGPNTFGTFQEEYQQAVGGK